MKTLRALTVFVATVLASGLAFAENDGIKMMLPPAQCNHDGLQPNHAAGLGNWTGVTRWAFCGIARSYSQSVVDVKVNKVGEVFCDMREITSDSSSYWLTTYSAIYNNGTYQTIDFPNSSQALGQASALQCEVRNNALLNSIFADLWIQDDA